MRSRTGRWFRTGALSVLGGVLLALLIAHACVLWSKTRPQDVVNVVSAAGQRDWELAPSKPNSGPTGVKPDPEAQRRFVRLEAAVRPDWMASFNNYHSEPRAKFARTDRGLGLEVETLTMGEMTLGVYAAELMVVRCGWPFPCLTAKDQEFGAFDALGTKSNWEAGFAGPASLHPASHVRVIPYDPLWPGLLADAACFAAAFWSAAVGASALGRALRQRAGHCSKCRYDRRGLAADAKCPECGTVPTPAPK